MNRSTELAGVTGDFLNGYKILRGMLGLWRLPDKNEGRTAVRPYKDVS